MGGEAEKKKPYYVFSNAYSREIREYNSRNSKKSLNSINVLWFFGNKKIVFSSLKEYIDRLIAIKDYYEKFKITHFKQYDNYLKQRGVDLVKVLSGIYNDMCEGKGMTSAARKEFISKVITDNIYSLMEVAKKFVSKLSVPEEKKAEYCENLDALVDPDAKTPPASDEDDSADLFDEIDRITDKYMKRGNSVFSELHSDPNESEPEGSESDRPEKRQRTTERSRSP